MKTIEKIIQATKEIPIPKRIAKIPFGDLLWPWIDVARKRLRSRAKKQLKLLLPEAILSLEESLVERWSQVIAPSLSLEMSIYKLEHNLEGDTSRDRFLDFLRKKCFNKSELRAFFNEYKELARLVCLLLDLWEKQAVEFLKRLEKDLPLLNRTFHDGKALGKVSSLAPNAGDYHEKGRSVYQVTFSSGRELFYKPKNLSFAVTFHAFLDQLHEMGLPLDLKGYRLLSLKDHGWEEKVMHLPCNSAKEVARYFERAGMLLCLLYLFDATDIHYENIIASGEHPILIDLETFFHSTLSFPNKLEVSQVFSHSVLRTALLPIFVEKEGKRGADISGLSGETETLSAFLWKKINTDEMERREEKISEKKHTHRVVLKGKLQNAHDHVETIVHGFRTMYSCLEKNKKLLTKKGGLVDRLADFPVRMVVRATRLYGYLLERLASPTAMLHEEERAKELNVLSKLITEPAKQSHLLPLIAEEKRAILARDVPFFLTYPKQKHLYAGDHFVLKNCLDGKVHTRTRERFQKMNQEECKKQETFIRHAFFAKQAEFHTKNENRATELTLVDHSYSKSELLEGARSIGHAVLKNSYRSLDGSLGWICLEANPQFAKFELKPVSESLYGGKVGIALFLSALFVMTQEKKWKEEALNTLKSLRHDLSKGQGKRITTLMGIGGMTGVGSVIYGFAKIGKLLHTPALFEQASSLVDEIEQKHIENDPYFDIIAGSAGLLLALLTLWEITQEKKCLDLAISVGDYLVREAHEIDAGKVGWQNRDGLCLLGFSHGAAGIAYALLKLSSCSGTLRFKQIAEKALAYERSLFCPKKSNWPRLREDGVDSDFPIQWCHGAPGIGFGRLASMPLLKDPKLMEEVKIAHAQTEQNLFLHGKLHLCCGASGKLEFLRSASHLTIGRDKDLSRVVFSILSHYKNQTPAYFDPGFMQGASGIGYTLLRTLDQKKLLPQVLLLD